MKEFKVEYYLESAKHSLAIWEKGVKEIEDGTFKYDGSMPESCTNALYYSKVEVYKDVIEYLESLPLDLVLATSRGLTEEGVKYCKMVNK